MNKKLIAIIMILAMVLVLAVGCQPAATTGGTTAGTTTAATTTGKPAETVELVWIMGNPGKVPADQAAVEAKLDEISVAKLNVKVKTLYYDNEKTMLALSTGEAYDMVFTCEWFNNYAVQANAGYFADLTEKIETVTPDLYKTMPEVVWQGTKVSGKIFAIPVKKDYAAEMYYRFDKALFVDALGMEVKTTMKFADVEAFLKAAKDAFIAGKPEAANAEFPLKLTKGGFGGIDADFDMINRDVMLGIPYSAVGTADENKVVITIESPDLTDRLTALNKWFKAGYINQDAATVDDVGTYSAVKVGQGFYGADGIWSGGDGYTQLISKFSGPYLSTASIRGSMNAISANTDSVDLALKYQELVNTDQSYRDILRYGIEGTHWNKNDKGLVVKTQAGRDNYGPWAFSQGSYSLSSVEASEGIEVDPNMWQVIFDGYKTAVATKSIGFSFDVAKVETQIAACKVVKDKYWVGLATGTADPATTIPTMLAELEAAGIRDVQKECQTQYDAFIAAQG